MANDFFGISIAGNLDCAPAEGGGASRVYEFWIGNKNLPADMEALADLSYLTEVTVVLGEGLNSNLSLTLAPPFEQGLAILNSEMMRQMGKGHLNVTIGYSTGSGSTKSSTGYEMSVSGNSKKTFPFSGLVMAPKVTTGSDITIVFEAVGVGYSMVTDSELIQASFRDKTASEIVKEVVQKYQATHTGTLQDSPFDNSDIFALFSDQEKTSLPFFKEKIPSLERGPKNDWFFIIDMLHRYGLSLFVHGDFLRVIPESSVKKAPQKKFVLRGVLDPDNDVYPILGYAQSDTGVFLRPGAGATLMQGVEDKKKADATVAKDAQVMADQIKKYQSKSGELARKKKGKKTSKDSSADSDVELSLLIDSTIVPLAALVPADPKDTWSRKLAIAELKNANAYIGLTATITTVGLPSLLPDEMIEVVGFSFGNQVLGFYDGAYKVLKVTHKIGHGGFTTEFVALSKGLPESAIIAQQGKQVTVTDPATEGGSLDSIMREAISPK